MARWYGKPVVSVGRQREGTYYRLESIKDTYRNRKSDTAYEIIKPAEISPPGENLANLLLKIYAKTAQTNSKPSSVRPRLD